MVDVVGREAELGIGDAFLDRAASGPTSLLIEGEAGIGKTTVWAEVVRRASGRGYRILVAHPARAEAELTLATLGDLLEPFDEARIAVLPDPQRAAIDAALLRAAPSSPPVQPRALGAALRSLVTTLAAEGPVIVAIDDAQWVDPVSATTIGYALRRAGSAPISLLAARRTGTEIPAGLLDGGLDRAETQAIGSMSVAALHHIVKRQLDHVPSRPTLIRIHQASDGNPLFAIEIARLLAKVGEPAASEPLPVPDDVRDLIARRVRGLPRPTRQVLLAAAALAAPTPELVARAVGRDVAEDLLLAEDEGVARVVGDRVAFAHPLLGAAVYRAAPAADRRAMHAALAALLPGTEEGARHLALAATGPDRDVAAALEAAAASSVTRGAPAAAARLVELAIGLTPADDDQALDRLTMMLADLLARGGDGARATSILAGLVERSDSPEVRARARLLLAPLRNDIDGPNAAIALCEAVLDEATGIVAVDAEAHALIANVSHYDLARGYRHLDEALRLLDLMPEPDPRVLVLALQVRCGQVIDTPGAKLDWALIEQGLEAERRAPRPSVGERFIYALGTMFKYLDDFAAARKWYERTLQAAIDEGDDSAIPAVLGQFPQVELWSGDWPAAEAYAQRGLEMSTELGLELQRLISLFNLATIHAHQGRVDEARREIVEVLERCEAKGELWMLTAGLPTLGLLELSLGNADAAVRALQRTAALLGDGDESPRRFEADYVEALVLAGRLDDAATTFARFKARADRYGRPAALANLGRAQGLMQAERGDLAGALSAIEVALLEHEHVTIPFDRARTLLALGQVHRRRKERRAASGALEDALATFERLGAPIWADRAREELDRLGLRRSAADELTEGERRVAELAARGMTNREVASALFLSPKTVEAHLARAYQKLGIASRAELGAVIARGIDAPGAS